MIHLVLFGGTPADVEKASIRDVQPLGDGCVIYLRDGPPLRAMQSMDCIMALWKSDKKPSFCNGRSRVNPF